ncbi:MAG TPA: phosphotransferase [Herpetosiphonaceae bacterium]
MIDGAALARIWRLAEPVAVRPIAGGGVNNHVLLVEAADGVKRVLRMNSNHSDPQRIRYELYVTDWLQRRRFSFAVPEPIPARDGVLWAAAPGGDGLLTLWSLVPGGPVDTANLAQARAAGRALAELLPAMAEIPSLPAEEAIMPPAHGDLRNGHPLVPDPLAALAALALEEPLQTQIQALMSDMLAAAPELYRSLPVQFSHGDFVQANLLAAGDEISAVLDFEFAAHDLELMDFAVLLSWWVIKARGTGAEWPLLDAIGGGFSSLRPLGADECDLLPTLFRLREAMVICHFLGRHAQGLDSLEQLRRHLAASARIDSWALAEASRLVRLARGWRR